jgi:type 1 glutamine amidotransferase
VERASVCVAVLLLAWSVGCESNRTPGAPASPPSAPAPPPSEPAPPPISTRVLVVTHTAGFRHSSIPIAESTIAALGTSGGLYATEYCRTEADVKSRLTPDGLASIDAVVFANTTGNLGIPDMAAFLSWIAAGHGFVATHSASDTYHDAPEYLAMLGGQFVTHGAIVEAEIRVDDPSDPSVAHLSPRFRITDELYRFAGASRSTLHALLSMDRIPPDGVGEAGAPADLLMAWRREHGRGRVFYTALGHREEVWQDARFRQHLLEGIRWAVNR